MQRGQRATTMLMRILFVLLLISGCATRPPDASDSLVKGGQAEIDTFSRRVLAGEKLITAEMLDDDRPVDRTVIVRMDRNGERAQYGVDLVSEYLMCLLEARAHTTTRRLIGIAPSDSRCQSEDACEVCNSLTYPLPKEERDALRRYWRARVAE